MSEFANFKKVFDLMMVIKNNAVLLGINDLDDYDVTFNLDGVYNGDCRGFDIDHTGKAITISVNEKENKNC